MPTNKGGLTMKALRLVVYQNSANYKKEETVENKMTYPLPPLSTVIGALHAACGYREYHPMDISIQGCYEAMHREPYTDHCYLNSLQDDRGILVKMKNPDLLSNGYEMVASAKKNQGNSFRKGVTIQVHNQELLDEYRNLKDISDEYDAFKKQRIDPLMDLIKKRKKTLAAKKKALEKKSAEYQRVANREAEIKVLEKKINQGLKDYKRVHYDEPISYFRSLTKSLKFYEILDDIKLILHIRAEENTLEELLSHAYDLKCIGRSEDAVYVENAEIVDLIADNDDALVDEFMQQSNGEIESVYSAYLDYGYVKEERFFMKEKSSGFSGTKYYLNKKYEIVDGKRVFEKKKAIYASNFVVEEIGDGVYLDSYKGQPLIVNFL